MFISFSVCYTIETCSKCIVKNVKEKQVIGIYFLYRIVMFI